MTCQQPLSHGAAGAGVLHATATVRGQLVVAMPAEALMRQQQASSVPAAAAADEPEQPAAALRSRCEGPALRPLSDWRADTREAVAQPIGQTGHPQPGLSRPGCAPTLSSC